VLRAGAIFRGMASFSSLVQGVLFAALQCGALALLLEEAEPLVGAAALEPLAPRLLAVVFLGSLLLGAALSEHLRARALEPAGGAGAPLAGGAPPVLRPGAVGQLAAALGFLYACAAAALLAREPALVLPAVLACAHVFALAAARKPAAERNTAASALLAALAVGLAVPAAVSRAAPAQEAAAWFGGLFGFAGAPLADAGLLADPARGGLFARPELVAAVMAPAAAALVLLPAGGR
jgi:hypothetical protein